MRKASNVEKSMNGVLPTGKALDVEAMQERLKQMGSGLNQLRSDREQLSKQLEDVNEAILRTEGAYVMLQSMVKEIGGVRLA